MQISERIKQLMLEAGYASPELATRAIKLSELIVKECISLLPDDCQSKNGCHTSWVIKEHFGITND
jgi:hypothetical protein